MCGGYLLMQRHINKGKKRHPSYSMAECDNERNHNNEIMAVVEMDLERGLLRNVNKLDLLGDFRQSNGSMPRGVPRTAAS